MTIEQKKISMARINYEAYKSGETMPHKGKDVTPEDVTMGWVDEYEDGSQLVFTQRQEGGYDLTIIDNGL